MGGILKNNNSFEFSLINNYIYLSSPFDPSRQENGIPLPENQGYNFNGITSNFSTGNTKLFTYSFGARIGEFFNGKITSLRDKSIIDFNHIPILAFLWITTRLIY